MSEDFDTEELLAEEEPINYAKVHLFLAAFVPLIAVSSRFVGFLASQISSLYFKPEDKERQLLKTAVELKKEMKSISMVDEFAKYAKIQRRLNQITVDLDATVGCRQSMQSQLKTILTYAGYLLLAIITAITFYIYRSVPVFIVPETWFFPLSSFLAYPTGVPGGISVYVWLFLCRNMLPIILKTKS